MRVTGLHGYSETLHYDSLSRLDQRAIVNSGESFTISQTYDADGRPSTVTYPTGLRTRNDYDSTTGALAAVRNDNSQVLYWQLEEINAEGQTTKESFGNGAVTDRTFVPETGMLERVKTSTTGGGVLQDLEFEFNAIGNLKWRENDVRGLREDFTYDNINRLATSTIGGQTKTFGYDALGNLTAKPGVGTLVYGQNGAGPHQLTSTSGTITTAFTYDANGSMLTGWNRTYEWTSAGQAERIVDGNTGNESYFEYGPDGQRIRQVAHWALLKRTTLYVGGIYEKSVDSEWVPASGAGPLTRERCYIGDFAILIQEEQENEPTITKTHYLHRDHLDSIELRRAQAWTHF